MGTLVFLQGFTRVLMLGAAAVGFALASLPAAAAQDDLGPETTLIVRGGHHHRYHARQFAHRRHPMPLQARFYPQVTYDAQGLAIVGVPRVELLSATKRYPFATLKQDYTPYGSPGIRMRDYYRGITLPGG